MKNVYRQIKHHEHELTKLERDVAEYFIQKKPVLNLRSLSNEIYLSPATISRFVRKIEFASYEEFIEAYDYMLNKEKIEKQTDILNTHLNIIQMNHDLIQKSTIDTLIKRIQEKKVLVVAFEDTAIACMDFVNRLKRLGIDARIATTKQEMMLESNFINEEDVIIAVSISGHNEIIKKYIKHQKKDNRYIFGISTEITQMIELCDDYMLLYLDNNSIMTLNYSYAMPLIVFFDYIFINLQHDIKLINKKEKSTHKIISE